MQRAFQHYPLRFCIQCDGFPLVVSEFLQTFPKGIAAGQINSFGIAGQITEQWNLSRPLRLCGERPCNRCSTEQCDELPSPHELCPQAEVDTLAHRRIMNRASH
jgi:hypothetical protein